MRAHQPAASAGIVCRVNGRTVALTTPAEARLTLALRGELGLTGTKVGCDAGDCGLCTVLVDGQQVCACLVAVGQVAGCEVRTVEGLAGDPRAERLQRAFVEAGAVQCGICTPGMLMAAVTLLDRPTPPARGEIEEAIGGVLCRCTGYGAIVAAVASTFAPPAPATAAIGPAVGARLTKVDGWRKATGAEVFGADAPPPDALAVRVVRSPHARARITVGDLDALRHRVPGLALVLTAADVPVNAFGVIPAFRDQPVLAAGEARFRGEAVLALVGEAEALAALRLADLPVAFEPLPPATFADARAGRAPTVLSSRPDNVLIEGRVATGDLDTLPAGALAVTHRMTTAFVEHAYLEPEAGWARCRGDRVELHVSTQSPYLDRDETAHVLGLAPERVRVVPTACGGGFGGKLDVSVQPLLALAAVRTGRPVKFVYDRIASMAASTKRHPMVGEATLWVAPDGAFEGLRFHGDFDTGAYASWGPTVAGRVPVHATGPYRVARVLATSRALHTHAPPSGAFRGFGVPQAMLLTEQLIDLAAARLGRDPLELRRQNALRAGDATATGQRLDHSVGIGACLDALAPGWADLRRLARAQNARGGLHRWGVGVASVWYGCGNTGMSNPASQRVTLEQDGRLILWNGVQDIGQGSNTILRQILADALGVPVDRVEASGADTDLTLDCGKTSASRQTFVGGRATQLAGEDLRHQLLRLANAGPEARLVLEGPRVRIVERGHARVLDLAEVGPLEGRGTFDPPTTALDADGQGAPYASYGFGAQVALVRVDTELATVAVERIVAAYDVGRAINPQQVEGQILGGIAQGLGLALMEEYVPGRTENLHDYLIPTVGDVPEVTVHLIEDADPLGPFGAKGVGEHALIPTAPAILNAIADAVGVRLDRVPVLPHRLHAALQAAR